MLRATVILVTHYLTMKKASKIWKERYGGRYHYTNFRMDKDVFLKLKRMKGLMKWNYFFKEIVNIKQKFENEINLFLKHCENKKAQHRCSTCVVLGDLKLRLYEKRIETNAQQKTEYTSFNCYMNFPTVILHSLCCTNIIFTKKFQKSATKDKGVGTRNRRYRI